MFVNYNFLHRKIYLNNSSAKKTLKVTAVTICKTLQVNGFISTDSNFEKLTNWLTNFISTDSKRQTYINGKNVRFVWMSHAMKTINWPIEVFIHLRIIPRNYSDYTLSFLISFFNHQAYICDPYDKFTLNCTFKFDVFKFSFFQNKLTQDKFTLNFTSEVDVLKFAFF